MVVFPSCMYGCLERDLVQYATSLNNERFASLFAQCRAIVALVKCFKSLAIELIQAEKPDVRGAR